MTATSSFSVSLKYPSKILRALRIEPAPLSSSFIFPAAFAARTLAESGKIFLRWKHTTHGRMTASSFLKSFTPFPSIWRKDRQASKVASLPWVPAVHSHQCWVKKKIQLYFTRIFWSWMIKTSFLPLASSQRVFVKMSSWQINLISFLDKITA